MPTWKLILEYDGTRYHGWQEQKNSRTVAGVVRQAAESCLGAPIDLGGAGRTDAGVHALAQVAHLRCRRRVSAESVGNGINDKLPSDVHVLSAEDADSRFDARRDAVARFYIYQISVRRSAFAKPYVWWVKDHLNLSRMNQAVERLPGRHDFAEFADKRTDEDRSTVVVVESAELGLDGDLILFRIGASHYLWKMVRRIVGMLVEVGRGKLSPTDLESMWSGTRSGPVGERQGRDMSTRTLIASKTAPASGLFLERVFYGPGKPAGLAPAVPISGQAREPRP